MNICMFDDEKSFCDTLISIIEDFYYDVFPKHEYNLSFFTKAAEFYSFVDQNEVDVVFLDISTPENENCGLEMAKQIRVANEDVHIVFVTSRQDKMINTFGGFIRPTDFLIKPVSKELTYSLLTGLVNKSLKSREYVALQFGRKEYLIRYDDIYTIQKLERKTVVFLENRRIEVINTISSLKNIVPHYFVLIDKGVWLNVKKVKKINYDEKSIILENDAKVYMSRNAKSTLKSTVKSLDLILR